MPIRFNHTILPARDAQRSAGFLADLLGVTAPRRMMPFHVVDIDDDASIDYMTVAALDGGFVQHVAFLVDDATFDAVLARIHEQGLAHHADAHAARAGINHNDGGRGVYVDDPDGNKLEFITKPYGR